MVLALALQLQVKTEDKTFTIKYVNSNLIEYNNKRFITSTLYFMDNCVKEWSIFILNVCNNCVIAQKQQCNYWWLTVTDGFQ